MPSALLALVLGVALLLPLLRAYLRRAGPPPRVDARLRARPAAEPDGRFRFRQLRPASRRLTVAALVLLALPLASHRTRPATPGHAEEPLHRPPTLGTGGR